MYRIHSLSHTADVGFEVEAPSVAALFEGAAAGLVAMLVGDGDTEVDGDGPRVGGNGDRERLFLSRPDRERLLVAWLRELLYRIQTNGTLPRVERIHVEEPATLEAEVGWGPDRRQDLVREIKGVTYHGLRIEERDGGWHARVVLDV